MSCVVRIRTTLPPRRWRTVPSTTRPRAPASSASSIRRPARSRRVELGPKSAPHGVIVGPDGAPWITDGGQNAIVRVDPKTRDVKKWPLPQGSGYAQSQHADVRSQGPRMVYRAVRHLRTRGSRHQRRQGVAGAARQRARTGSRRRRAATSTMHRWPAITSRASMSRPAAPRSSSRRRQGPGRAPRVVGLARPDLGQLLEHRPGRHVRSRDARMARMEAARQRAHVFGLGRRRRTRCG